MTGKICLSTIALAFGLSAAAGGFSKAADNLVQNPGLPTSTLIKGVTYAAATSGAVGVVMGLCLLGRGARRKDNSSAPV